MSYPLNVIFYGPPGTGKTYNSIIRAMKIADPGNMENYENEGWNNDYVRRFQLLQEQGKIRFVTFHQNFSYEDFVQGLKPDFLEEENTDDKRNVSNSPTFRYEDGAFMRSITNALFEYYVALQQSEQEHDDAPKQIDLDYYYLTFITEYERRRQEEIKLGREPSKLRGYRSTTQYNYRVNRARNLTLFNDRGLHQVSYGKDRVIENYELFKEKKAFEKEISLTELNVTSQLWAIVNAFNGHIEEQEKKKEKEENERRSKKEQASSNDEDEKVDYSLSHNEKKLRASSDIVKRTKGMKEPVAKNVIIIDEINRANISNVFGELISLIEDDKRLGGKFPLSIVLPSGDELAVPPNLYIIGTMNTADKSLAMLDVALRRRFRFEALYPDLGLVKDNVSKDVMEKLNSEIRNIMDDRGYDHQIGHSFFMKIPANNGEESMDALIDTMNKEIIPLLMEYFMNDGEKVIKILEKTGFIIDSNSPRPIIVTKHILKNE